MSYNRNKRQHVSSGGRSSSELSKEIETFENMSSEVKMTALFTKLSTTEVKVDSIHSSLHNRLLNTPTNHSHAKLLSIPILVNYFL